MSFRYSCKDVAHEMAPFGVDQIQRYEQVPRNAYTSSNDRSDRCIVITKPFRRLKVFGIEVLARAFVDS